MQKHVGGNYWLWDAIDEYFYSDSDVEVDVEYVDSLSYEQKVQLILLYQQEHQAWLLSQSHQAKPSVSQGLSLFHAP